LQRALVIANPIAGKAKANGRLERLERGLAAHGIATTRAVTTAPGDAHQHAASQASNHDVVVIVGGDGTVNEVVNGLDSPCPIAVWPHGTGNVLAKELRLPRRLEPFCGMVAAGRQAALDVPSAGGKRFVCMAGVGFDAAVATRLAERRAGGIRMSTYAAPLLRCFATYRFPRLRVTLDGGQPLPAEGFVLVTNVRAYGGPFVLAPQAEHDDGLLDVCLLPRGSKLRLLRAMLACMIGAARRLSGLRHLRARHACVTADEPVHYQVDGDPMGFLPATFAIGDRKQLFIVP